MQYMYNPATACGAGFLRSKFDNSGKNIQKSFVLGIASAVFTLNAYADDKYVSVGDKLQIAVPVTALMISLTKGDFTGAGEMAEGAFWTAAETHALKAIVNENRPNGMDNNSFPSGHSSAAFQGAAFLQMRYGWKYGLPAYAAASFVGYSRVRGKYHYWHDVAAGAILAYGTQYVITEMGYNMTSLMISPAVGDDFVSLEVSASF